MTNDMNELNKANIGELTEDQLKMISGGAGAASDIEETMRPFRQPDGTYRYTCDKCNEVLIANSAQELVNKICEHIGKHINVNFDIPNYYPGI